MPVISLVNLKGGCGKTTSAIALATVASRKGLDVMVVDGDPQGSACDWAFMAEEGGDPLPFRVVPANLATVKRLTCLEGQYIFIDCPPSGSLTDAAVEASDYVLVPMAATPVDFNQADKTVQEFIKKGVDYALLITRAKSKTVALREIKDMIAKQDYSCFDTVIPAREDISNSYGQNFKNLFGYESVFGELQEAIG